MRKVILVLLVGLWAFTLGSSPARADGMILPETLSPDYLIVRYHRIAVTIKDNHAVTQVEQEFYNPHPFPVEGRHEDTEVHALWSHLTLPLVGRLSVSATGLDANVNGRPPQRLRRPSQSG